MLWLLWRHTHSKYSNGKPKYVVKFQRGNSFKIYACDTPPRWFPTIFPSPRQREIVLKLIGRWKHRLFFASVLYFIDQIDLHKKWKNAKKVKRIFRESVHFPRKTNFCKYKFFVIDIHPLYWFPQKKKIFKKDYDWHQKYSVVRKIGFIGQFLG